MKRFSHQVLEDSVDRKERSEMVSMLKGHTVDKLELVVLGADPDSICKEVALIPSNLRKALSSETYSFRPATPTNVQVGQGL